MQIIAAFKIFMIANRPAGRLCATIMAASLASEAFASDPQRAPYAGEDKREIKSLSATDIVALREGQGWGLAKSAELNGYPGPLHVLQLSDKLALTSEQQTRIQDIFDKMKRAAQATGQDYLRAERAIDQAFANGKATVKLIETLTHKAAQLRAHLRAIHLYAHLETTPLLTRHQRMIYKKARGYNAPARGSHRGQHNNTAQ